MEIRPLKVSASRSSASTCHTRKIRMRWHICINFGPIMGYYYFRNQRLEECEVVKFSRLFGELEIHVREEYLSPNHPELLIVSNVKKNGKPIGILSDHEVGWHHDQIYLPRPAVGSLLYSVKIPDSGGNTAFCDQAGSI